MLIVPVVVDIDGSFGHLPVLINCSHVWCPDRLCMLALSLSCRSRDPCVWSECANLNRPALYFGDEGVMIQTILLKNKDSVLK